MSNLLILVHGMGAYAPHWSNGWVAKLDAVASGYSAFKSGAPFSKRVTISEVRYDDVFEQFVDEWKGEADAFAEFQKKNSLELPTLTKWLTGPTLPGDEKNFFWSKTSIQSTTASSVAVTLV